jgi:hypothetical protein
MKSLSLGLMCLSMGCATEMTSEGTAHVRVAHLSPDAPNVDFCLAPHGSSDFGKPVLATLGHATGLAYGNVTKYFDLPAEQYDVRLVAPNAADCTTPIGGLRDFTNLPEIPADASVTIGAEGLVSFGATRPFDLRAYIDDATVTDGKAKLRFVHASPGTPSVDVGLGGGALFQSVFSDISYGGISATTNGYVETDPFEAAEISARAHGTFSDALAIKPAALPAGAIATAFAIGQLDSMAAPLRVLLCVDNAAPNGLLSQCSIVGGAPERARIRIAHLSPDTPAVDVCLAPEGTGAFGRPLLKSLGSASGLSYAQLTTYVDLPTGKYDVRIIHATATGCGTGAVPDTKSVGLHNGLVATVAAIGVLDPTGPAAANPGLQLAVYVDATTVGAANTKLRFVHASPGTPNVDVGILSGGIFTKIFANVAFGGIGTNAPLDTYGFIETGATTVTISARVANTHSDALVIPNVQLPQGSILTAFAIGGKTGAATNPLKVLLCADNAPANGLLSSCTVAP